MSEFQGPMVWCAHCDHREPEGTMAGDFLRLHIAWVEFVRAVGEATGAAAIARWINRRLDA